MSARKDLARELRIVQYLKDGWTAGEIAYVENIKDYYANTLSMEVAEKFDMVHVDAKGVRSIKRGKPANRPDMLGFNETTRSFRSNLAGFLGFVSKNRTRKEVATMLGLRPTEQNAALGSGLGRFNHNWTLSQLNRLAIAADISFTDLIAACNDGLAGYTKWFERKKRS